MRIGVATDLVVVSDLLGSGEAQERGVVGIWQRAGRASPHRIRLSSLKAPDGLLGSLFELEDLGTVDLKGSDPPV